MKNMRNLIIVAILILIVVVLFAYQKTKSANTEPLPDVDTTASATEIPAELLAFNSFVINTNQSMVNWEGKKTLLVDYVDRGTLKLKSGEIKVENGQFVSGEVIIDMNSLAASSTGKGDGESNLTKHLKSADFFNVETYPEAKFVAKSGVEQPNGSFMLTGDLTIKDKTNEVSIPAAITQVSSTSVSVAGKIELDRTLWDVRFGSGKFFEDLGDAVIDDKFTVEFVAVFNPVK